jgi:hypothetical protein
MANRKSQPRADRKKPLRCLLEVRKLPIEQFKHPGHSGRQWRSHARKLWNLLCELASYANPDGTFGVFSPSIETLLKHHSESSLYRMLDSLRDLSFLDWTRENHYARRSYTIILPEKNTCQTSPDSGENHLSNSQPKSEITCQAHEKHLSRTIGETPVTVEGYPSLEEPSKEPSRERETAVETSAPKGGATDTCSLSPKASRETLGHDPQTERQVRAIKLALAKKELSIPKVVAEIITELVADGYPAHIIIAAANEVPDNENIPALWLRDNLEMRAIALWDHAKEQAAAAKRADEDQRAMCAEVEARLAEIEAAQAALPDLNPLGQGAI